LMAENFFSSILQGVIRELSRFPSPPPPPELSPLFNWNNCSPPPPPYGVCQGARLFPLSYPQHLFFRFRIREISAVPPFDRREFPFFPCVNSLPPPSSAGSAPVLKRKPIFPNTPPSLTLTPSPGPPPFHIKDLFTVLDLFPPPGTKARTFFV